MSTGTLEALSVPSVPGLCGDVILKLQYSGSS